MIKILDRLWVKKTYARRIKAKRGKPGVTVLVRGQKHEALPPRSEQDKAVGVCFDLFCLIVLGILAGATGHEEEIRGTHTGKEAVKVLLFADGIILHMAAPKDSSRERLKLMITFSNAACSKINIRSCPTP